MNADIAEHAARLLSISGIEKVVSIDDDYSTRTAPAELLAVLKIIDQTVLTNSIGPLLSIENDDRELIRDRVRDSWEELGDAIQQTLIAQLTPPKELGAEGEALADDLRFATKLPEIFGDKLVALTLEDWEKRQGEIIYDAMPRTLLLVDLSFANEQRGHEDGLRIIADLLKKHPKGNIYCGLLTGSPSYTLATVHQDWKKIADDNGLSQDRFVLIPKASLRSNQGNFLSLIKLAIMNTSTKSLQTAVSKIILECVAQADKELDRIDVYEFERIICLSSAHEGIWEPDTLLRIFSLFHKKFVRRSLRSDDTVRQLADLLRKLSSIRVGEWGGPTPMEIALRRLEWFEEAVDINEQHLPIELGDLFLIDGKPDKRFVLVAQPCDLMMRQEGERHQTVKNCLLLEASPLSEGSESGESSEKAQRAEEPGLFFKLDFYENERDWRVNLRKIHYINLDVLDLCVFRQDGRAVMSRTDEAPIQMSEPWRVRFPRLSKEMMKSCTRYAELMKVKGLSQQDALKIVANATLGNLLKAEVKTDTSSISYNIQRIGRLKQPRSGALLARYANTFARDAFEHDLTQRPVPAKTGDQDSAEQSCIPEAILKAEGGDFVLASEDPKRNEPLAALDAPVSDAHVQDTSAVNDNSKPTISADPNEPPKST